MMPDRYYNPAPYRSANQPSSNRKPTIQEYFNEHRLLAIILLIISFTVMVAIIGLIIWLSRPEEIQQEPEDAPYITYVNDYLVNDPFIGSQLLLYVNLILTSNEEMSTAPTDNNHNANHIVTFDQNSYAVSDLNATESLSSIDINVSDGRKYTLRLLIDMKFDDESAVAILDRVDSVATQDYIITFTNKVNPYTKLPADAEIINDYITGDQLIPLPKSTDEWINTLNLTDVKIYHTTFPSVR